MSWFKTSTINEPDTVICSECRHVVERESAQQVPIIYDFYHSQVNPTLYFCREHRKLYETRRYERGKLVFYRNMPVGEDGCPIGYVPKTRG